MAIPGVLEAAVVAVPDPRWVERPLACVVANGGARHGRGCPRPPGDGFARWQLPERVELIDEVSKTAVGKFDKKVLRARFGAP